MSVAHKSSQKLGFKYFGPFQIIQPVGAVSYKLQLPEKSKIHPVVHVSQLKKALRPGESASSALPIDLIDLSVPVQPMEIHDERMIRKGSKHVPQLFVQWEKWPDTCCTWENLYTMVDEFPHTPAWGQAGFSGRGIVTTHILPKALQVKYRAEERQRIREAHLTKGSTCQRGPDASRVGGHTL